MSRSRRCPVCSILAGKNPRRVTPMDDCRQLIGEALLAMTIRDLSERQKEMLRTVVTDAYAELGLAHG